jgi:hypothetical protein
VKSARLSLQHHHIIHCLSLIISCVHRHFHEQFQRDGSAAEGRV